MKQRKWECMLVASFLTSLMACGIVLANESDNVPAGNRNEISIGGPEHPQKEKISTDAYEATVREILGRYDASSLTQADAVAINNAFREAGIRRGSTQRQAIIAAGFDPQTISSLDPPPKRKEDSPSSPKRNAEE